LRYGAGFDAEAGFFGEDALKDAGAGIVVSSTDALATTLLGR